MLEKKKNKKEEYSILNNFLYSLLQLFLAFFIIFPGFIAIQIIDGIIIFILIITKKGGMERKSFPSIIWKKLEFKLSDKNKGGL